MYQFKKLISISSLTFSLVLMFALVSPNLLYASNSNVENSNKEIPEVIYQYIRSINDKDWDGYVKSYSPDRQPTNFPSEQQLLDRVGILSVDSIAISEIRELPEIYIKEIEPYFNELDEFLYNNIRYFYIGFDYKVHQENEFYYNGVMYELIAVGNLNSTDYIIGHEYVYNFDKLKNFGYTFDSISEEKAKNVIEQKEIGRIVNFNNELIPIKSYTSDSIGVTPQSATNPPNGLILHIEATGTNKTLGFDTYAKNVLPNEWIAGWKAEALRAGAVAIKSYAWYNVTYPRQPAKQHGAHLTDNWRNYQKYVEGSNHPNTDAAVDYVYGIFMRNSNGVVFDTQYRAGTSGQSGTESGGILSQHGTQYLATNYPNWNYKAILGYYYNFSDKSSGYIQVF
ncbi:SpoIID/LytB domain-containing protein [Paenibacillus lautus]|uniref:Sporulation stage II protein D amidase enhancer LytB N-terminal domain-containing protein n=1 Tax=Paenibacillus lautus TaxID=1401 RepID=A0A385TV31_PAELA|nr:SpoIID/LytB domain-containing protein [Paenibacillus lautus]AYB46888.1 hypothetical protein D5F53_27830 [Paenibacillus lautus]MBY0164604.1 SpoIID/LytB domain-containing protein [Cytobacillus firmus]MCI1773894.1 SpoIID/LytB domain-containing protein [Paenibacillus lautus]VTR59551.1 SpoIID/LytB domain [Actinobacillus pleuropneumoniae]